MKTNPHDFVKQEVVTKLVPISKDSFVQEITNCGLTKRELFAAFAMNGLEAANVINGRQEILHSSDIAKLAVRRADALIAELNK